MRGYRHAGLSPMAVKFSHRNQWGLEMLGGGRVEFCPNLRIFVQPSIETVRKTVIKKYLLRQKYWILALVLVQQRQVMKVNKIMFALKLKITLNSNRLEKCSRSRIEVKLTALGLVLGLGAVQRRF